MLFHKPRISPPGTLDSLFIGGSQIERLFEFRCLGANLDHCLKFKLHNLNVVKKLSKMFLIIYKTRDVLNERCWKMLYYSVIHPNIIYCASAWSCTFKWFFNPVSIVQKGVIRAMCGANRRTPSQDLFEELGLLKLTDVLKCVKIVYVYRSLAIPCLNEFSFQMHVWNTRQATKALLFVPNWRLTCCRNAIQYRGSAMYSEIPIDIRQIDNNQSFKRNLKFYITDSRVH